VIISPPDGDDDVADLLPCLDIPGGIDEVVEWVAPIDHGGLDERSTMSE